MQLNDKPDPRIDGESKENFNGYYNYLIYNTDEVSCMVLTYGLIIRIKCKYCNN